MHSRRRALGAVAVAAFLLMASVSPAMADSRCNGGPGVQTWENTYLSGRTVVWCADDHGQIRVSDLSTHHENLYFWENWDNRISSAQTFNFPSGFAACIYENINYNAGIGGDRKELKNNNTWNTLGSMNDRTSSIKYTASCPP